MAADTVLAAGSVAATALLSAAGYLLHRHVYRPLREDVTQALATAEEAQTTADELKQLLVGAEAEADRGELIRIREEIEDLADQQQRSNRLQTEGAHNLAELVRYVAEQEDDVEVEVKDDSIFLRGDKLSDGGLLFPRP